jgi:deazaflavin-dependent oxidoreductase (nitroreductase family)
MSLSSAAFRATLQAHAFVYERTDGLIGHRILGVPTLMLRTTGRRSGATRTNSLVYAKDGARWLVVASKGGADTPPAWLYNAQANPQVEVQIARTTTPATATVIDHDDPDFARVWKLVNDGNAGRFEAYQKQTARPIPVVALTPS